MAEKIDGQRQNRNKQSSNMDLIFSIFAAYFIVQWQPTDGYSLTNATDSGKFEFFLLPKSTISPKRCTLWLAKCSTIEFHKWQFIGSKRKAAKK